MPYGSGEIAAELREEIEDLLKELRASNERIKELEKELKDAGIKINKLRGKILFAASRLSNIAKAANSDFNTRTALFKLREALTIIEELENK